MTLIGILILLVGIAAIVLGAWFLWPKIGRFFGDSETLFYARAQLFVGALWTALVQADLAPLLPPEYLTIWLVVSGAITEAARRSRADDL